MRIILLLAVIIGFPANLIYGQKKIAPKKEIQWKKISNAGELLKKNPKKKLLIFIYTTWCPYCKKMDLETLGDQEVIKYINANYIPVKIDAETKDVLTYGGKKYAYLEKFGVNGLAYYLLDGKMGYPSSLSIDKDGKTSILRGFIKPKEFINQLKSVY